MKKILIFSLLSAILISCSKTDPDTGEAFLKGDGVFILNEGNFQWGNGSLSFYSYDSLKLYNSVFSQVNGRPLGDIPYSMGIYGSRAFILVNNSGKIEITDLTSLKAKSTIDSLISPRNICFINNSRAYVTSLYSDSVTIINPVTSLITGYVNIGCSSESVSLVGNKAYVANWVGGNRLLIIDTRNDLVTGSVVVGIEPESMVVDRNNFIWVLCNGGWSRENYAELIKINTETDIVAERFVFPDLSNSPSSLQINGTLDTLYYLENGVKRMGIDDPGLPSETFISDAGHLFYKMNVNPLNNEVFVTDAVDYQQKGYVMRFDRHGILLETLQADIIPGSMCFKNNRE